MIAVRIAYGIVIGSAGLGTMLLGPGLRLTQNGQARWQTRSDIKKNALRALHRFLSRS